jgi:hypothetical protein
MRRDASTSTPDEAPAAAALDASPEPDDADERVDALASIAVAERSPAAVAPRLLPGLRTAEIAGVVGAHARLVDVRLRGRLEIVTATLAPEVDRELVEHALEAGQSALVEVDEAGEAWVVGLVQTRVPERLVLRADSVVLQGESEIVLESGKAGMRLREDGDVELVGSRIMTMSRGLFRIVGRMLRLN